MLYELQILEAVEDWEIFAANQSGFLIYFISINTLHKVILHVDRDVLEVYGGDKYTLL